MSEKTLKPNQKLFYDMGGNYTNRIRILTLPDGIRLTATTCNTGLQVEQEEGGALIIKVKNI